MEKDIFKTSIDITTFLHYAKKEKVISEEDYKKLKKFCIEYIMQKEKNRNAIVESAGN